MIVSLVVSGDYFGIEFLYQPSQRSGLPVAYLSSINAEDGADLYSGSAEECFVTSVEFASRDVPLAELYVTVFSDDKNRISRDAL